MFTGIIQHRGQVSRIETHPEGATLWVRWQQDQEDLVLGESIAVDGICLTLTHHEGNESRFDLSPETLACTTAGQWEPNHSVNLERALAMGDRLGGHFVMGHVDQCLSVRDVQIQQEYLQVTFELPHPALRPALTPKGSVTINGVSLTINTVNSQGFSVMLIPHTQAETNLDALKAGDRVNMETDYLARLVAEQLKHFSTANP